MPNWKPSAAKDRQKKGGYKSRPFHIKSDFLFSSETLRIGIALRAANKLARHFAGRLTVFIGHHTINNRVAITVNFLNQAATAGGQVINHFRLTQLQRCKINHIHIGFHARGNHPAIMQAV